MGFWIEIVKFIIFSLLIVGIAKYLLVTVLRKLAESLNLKPKTVGNIAGISTSVPEFLTVSFSAMTGLIGASVYNILSSNVINLLQYIFSVLLNKNSKTLKNKALRIDIILVVITILIPIVLLFFNIEENILLVPIFVTLFIIFYMINNQGHKKYLQHVHYNIEEQIIQEEKGMLGKKGLIIKYTVYLVLIGVSLFIVGDLLGGTLENLANLFAISQFIIGIALGFVTSLPELITFFETQRHHNDKNSEMMGMVEATNNLLTSNILNLFVIQTIGIILFYFLS